MTTIVVSKPWPEEARIQVFLHNKQDYALLIPEQRVGGELFSLVRQYPQATIVLDRRHSPRS